MKRGPAGATEKFAGVNAPGRLAATLCLHARRNKRAYTLMMLHKLVLVAHGS